MWSKVAWDDYIWNLHMFCNQIDKQTLHKSLIKKQNKYWTKLLTHGKKKKKKLKFVKLKLFQVCGLKILKVYKLTLKLKYYKKV